MARPCAGAVRSEVCVQEKPPLSPVGEKCRVRGDRGAHHCCGAGRGGARLPARRRESKANKCGPACAQALRAPARKNHARMKNRLLHRRHFIVDSTAIRRHRDAVEIRLACLQHGGALAGMKAALAETLRRLGRSFGGGSPAARIYDSNIEAGFPESWPALRRHAAGRQVREIAREANAHVNYVW